MPTDSTARHDSALQWSLASWADPRLSQAYGLLDELYNEWRDLDGGLDALSEKFKRARDLCEEADVMIEAIRKGGFA